MLLTVNQENVFMIRHLYLTSQYLVFLTSGDYYFTDELNLKDFYSYKHDGSTNYYNLKLINEIGLPKVKKLLGQFYAAENFYSLDLWMKDIKILLFEVDLDKALH